MKNCINENRVSIYNDINITYNNNITQTYLEFNKLFTEKQIVNYSQSFDAVRKAFKLLKLDKDRIETEDWNPLSDLINKNNTVVLNPNFLTHKHKLNDDWDYCITNGSVIRAIVDYVYLALNGTGRIIIADGPQTDSNIEKILELTEIRKIQKFYIDNLNYKIEFIDFRDEKWIEKDGILIGKEKMDGDPAGSIIYDLGKNSMLAEIESQNPSYYGCHYDMSETMSHHINGKHEYSICRTPIEADVFINIPKLKTHKKCGLTVNLKSLVGGVNANKNYLPHYKIGNPDAGGDQFDKSSLKTKLENSIVLKFKNLLLKDSNLIKYISRKTKKLGYKVFGDTENVVRSGNWYGNDTVWRMCLDLNRILFYGDPDGTLNRLKIKKHFSIVDGIKSMEGNGPISGTMKETGLIIAGSNPVAVDAVCAKLMGFDYKKLPLINKCFEEREFPLADFIYEDIECYSNKEIFNKMLKDINYEDTFKFVPHFGWKGHVEAQ